MLHNPECLNCKQCTMSLYQKNLLLCQNRLTSNCSTIVFWTICNYVCSQWQMKFRNYIYAEFCCLSMKTLSDSSLKIVSSTAILEEKTFFVLPMKQVWRLILLLSWGWWGLQFGRLWNMCLYVFSLTCYVNLATIHVL